MKKTLTVVISLLVIVTAVFAIYRFNFRKSMPTEGELNERLTMVFEQNDCYACHSYSAPVPFYGQLPFMKSLVEKDMQQGVRYIDLGSINFSEINEADLSKIEHAVMTGSMPLMKYKMMHWGTGFNTAERSFLTEWIMNTRYERFSTRLASNAYATHALQPMVSHIETDSAKVLLGRALYHDTRLSLDNTVSCATCHPLDNGGVDGLRTSKGIDAQMGGINAPTVYNAVFNHVQFWNGRAGTLADQAAGPPVNPIEMGDQTWDDIVARLQGDAALVAWFNNLYAEGLTAENVTHAIAEFEKTLITPNAPFDAYLKGDETALTERQKKGFELFMANNCATCHVGQALGGQSFEHMGIMENYHAARLSERPEIGYNGDDDGLYGFTGVETDRHKYKVPILRNIALTAPYMHDGTSETLEEAVVAMYRFQLGKRPTESEVNYIVEFLHALTGTHPEMVVVAEQQ